MVTGPSSAPLGCSPGSPAERQEGFPSFGWKKGENSASQLRAGPSRGNFYEGRAARRSHVKAHMSAPMQGVRGEFGGGGGEVADE